MSLRAHIALVAVLLVVAPVCRVSAQGNAGQPPPQSATGTNSVARKDPLKALEDNLSKSFQPFAPNNSLDGIMAPPPGPVPRTVVPSKRVLDLLQKRKEALEKNGDLSLTPKEEDSWMLEFFENKKQKNKKPVDLDKFYEDLNRQQRGFGKGPGGTKANSKNVDAQPDRDSINTDPDDAKLPGVIGDTAQALRKMLSQGVTEKGSSTTPAPQNTTFGDMFGLGTISLPDKKADEKSFITEYKAWLNPPAQAPKSPLDAMAAAPEKSSVPAYSPMINGVMSSTYSPDLKQLADPNPVLTPSAPKDITTTVVNSWNPLYSPQAAVPKYEAPSYIPPRINFDAPRRKF